MLYAGHPGAILSESSLSFLGVARSAHPPAGGLMISQGKKFAYLCPWLVLAPGIAILLITLAL